MKKSLIYWISFGDHQSRVMTMFSILSVLKWNEFSGDFIVLSDATGLPSDLGRLMDRVKVINVFEKFPELESKVKNRYGIFCIKPLINKLVDIKNYDYILYLDSDILVKVDNFDALFSYWTQIGKIQISPNAWKVGRNNSTTGSQVLTDDEQEKWFNFGLCAGILGFPGNELGERLLNRWWDYNLDGKLIKDDQGNLTALILREFENDYKFCEFINEDYTSVKNITHYHAQNKPKFWDHVKYLLRDYEIPAPNLNGSWEMSKPVEKLKNTWYFKDGLVFVEPQMIVGSIQSTSLGIFVWWHALGGFEKIRFEGNIGIGDSSRGGEECFLLTKNQERPPEV